ncbi:MAG: Gp37 family protein [Syntrophales bacterium]|jgi:hypothetical protein|nr:Gp37 family protein [Syntrophales bacterium]MCK9390265.1 Gp37 family protein [Syntrophales bacterium]
MIDEYQNGIIEQLETITSVKTVDIWQGDIEELLKTPQGLPALNVVYRGADFEEKQTDGGHTMNFMIILVGKNVRSRKAGVSSCNAIIEAVRGVLIGYQVEGFDKLWPVSEDLMLARGGILVYALNYKTNNVLP